MWPAMYSVAARPSRRRAAPAKKRIWSSMGGISSDIVSPNGLPVFSHSVRTSSSARASMASAMRIRARLRSEGVERFQVANASLDETGRARRLRAKTRRLRKNLPRARVYSGAVLPPADLTCSPWIKLCNSRTGSSPRSLHRKSH